MALTPGQLRAHSCAACSSARARGTFGQSKNQQEKEEVSPAVLSQGKPAGWDEGTGSPASSALLPVPETTANKVATTTADKEQQGFSCTRGLFPKEAHFRII